MQECDSTSWAILLRASLCRNSILQAANHKEVCVWGCTMPLQARGLIHEWANFGSHWHNLKYTYCVTDCLLHVNILWDTFCGLCPSLAPTWRCTTTCPSRFQRSSLPAEAVSPRAATSDRWITLHIEPVIWSKLIIKWQYWLSVILKVSTAKEPSDFT